MKDLAQTVAPEGYPYGAPYQNCLMNLGDTQQNGYHHDEPLGSVVWGEQIPGPAPVPDPWRNGQGERHCVAARASRPGLFNDTYSPPEKVFMVIIAYLLVGLGSAGLSAIFGVPFWGWALFTAVVGTIVVLAWSGAAQ